MLMSVNIQLKLLKYFATEFYVPDLMQETSKDKDGQAQRSSDHFVYD